MESDCRPQCQPFECRHINAIFYGTNCRRRRCAIEIQAEDKLKLVVFGEEAISGDYTVSKDGLIHVAQVGSVKAAGLTIEQLQGELVKRLSNGIVDNPQVSLIVADDGS